LNTRLAALWGGGCRRCGHGWDANLVGGVTPRLGDGDTEAHLRARIAVLERERADAVARMERAEQESAGLRRDLLEEQSTVADLRADLRLWILRWRLRHWLIQMPPEPVFIPEQRVPVEQRKNLRTMRPGEVRAIRESRPPQTEREWRNQR
jgi:hypothetical protein